MSAPLRHMLRSEVRHRELAAEWELLGNPLRHVHLRGLVVWTVLLAGLVLALLWWVITDFQPAWYIGAGGYLAIVTARAAVTWRPGCVHSPLALGKYEGLLQHLPCILCPERHSDLARREVMQYVCRDAMRRVRQHRDGRASCGGLRVSLCMMRREALRAEATHTDGLCRCATLLMPGT